MTSKQLADLRALITLLQDSGVTEYVGVDGVQLKLAPKPPRLPERDEPTRPPDPRKERERQRREELGFV